MLVLLPPSESKVPGGDPSRLLDLDALSRPDLASARRKALARLRDLSSNLGTAAAALGLGSRNRGEAAVNRDVRRGPTLPAIDRFDGVLYDALGAAALDDEGRSWLDDNVAIASALFGLLSPADRIPAYRLSADTRVPGTSLREIWRGPVAASLREAGGPVVDLRSEAYAALGPAPAGSVFVRVVTGSGDRRRALNHFNKSAKGRLVRSLAASRADPRSVGEFVEWATGAGFRIERGVEGELDLIVDD